MHTFIIAEIGSAWAYSAPRAIEAVEVARQCGADAIKYQWTSDPREMERRRHVAERTYDILWYPVAWINDIHEECQRQGIEFMCSVYLPKDVDFMNPYVKRWKVASMENQANDLVLAMEATGKPLIISHGATGPRDDAWGKMHSVLHCTAAYPADISTLNLLAIRSLELGYAGYSDHSSNVLTGAIAVACGAKIVEVHFKLNDTPQENPDCKHSLTPYELREYIANIRQAEMMLGDGRKKIEPCEEWALKHKVKS